jgi:hypothetical protein
MTSATKAESARAAIGSQPNTRTVAAYNIRTSTPPILPNERKTPAHTPCDAFWQYRAAG